VRLVAVGGAEHHRHQSTLRYRDVPDRDRAGRLPRKHDDRRLPAQRLFDRPRHERAIGAHALESVARRQQRDQHVADQAERRLGAGRDEEAKEAHHVFVAQALAVDAPLDKPCDDVVPRCRTPRRQNRQEVVADLGRGSLRTREVPGEAHQLHRPPLIARVVGSRNPEHVGAHLHRVPLGEVRDEIGPRLVRDRIDELVDDLLEKGQETVESLRDERGLDERAMAAVLASVHLQPFDRGPVRPRRSSATSTSPRP
jgi:hypothetical protein